MIDSGGIFYRNNFLLRGVSKNFFRGTGNANEAIKKFTWVSTNWRLTFALLENSASFKQKIEYQLDTITLDFINTNFWEARKHARVNGFMM